MAKVRIIGHYITQFGELWDRSLESLFNEAVTGAIASVSRMKFCSKEIEAVFVANMASGQFSNQLHLNALVSQFLKHHPPGFRVEAACASGAVALELAQLALQAGKYKTVLVVGAEKMTDVTVQDATRVLSGASFYQAEYGASFPTLYALLAQAHMRKFGTTTEQLALVAVKNHTHALSNSKAQFRKKLSVKQVLDSALVAKPIKLLDCSPISDGAAAVILSTKDVKEYQDKVVVEAVGHAQDSLSLAKRASLLELKATRLAAQQAYEQAGIKAKDITFAEVHDCFTIAEILAIEDLGFFKKGLAGKAVERGLTSQGSKLVVNPSGGLKACGHPIGATGVKQVAFLAQLLERQVISKTPVYALAHNVGGSGATAVVHILSKGSKFL